MSSKQSKNSQEIKKEALRQRSLIKKKKIIYKEELGVNTRVMLILSRIADNYREKKILMDEDIKRFV